MKDKKKTYKTAHTTCPTSYGPIFIIAALFRLSLSRSCELEPKYIVNK